MRYLNSSKVGVAYDGLASEYDQAYANNPQVQAENAVLANLLRRLGFLAFGSTVLDMGCGTGLVLDLAHDVGRDIGTYRGLDVSRGMLDQAARKHPSHGMHFHRRDMRKAMGGQWSHVVSLFAGYYVEPDLLAARVLKNCCPGGTFLLALPTARPHEGLTWAHDERYALRVWHYTPRMVRQLYGKRAHLRGLSGLARRCPGLIGLEFRTVGRLLPGSAEYLVVWGQRDA